MKFRDGGKAVRRMEHVLSTPALRPTKAGTRQLMTQYRLAEVASERLLRELLLALAARPDVTRLFGPHEKDIYERGRLHVDAGCD